MVSDKPGTYKGQHNKSIIVVHRELLACLSLALRIGNYTGKYKPVHNVLHNLLIYVNEPLQNTNKLHTLAHRVSLPDTIEEATAKVCGHICYTDV